MNNMTFLFLIIIVVMGIFLAWTYTNLVRSRGLGDVYKRQVFNYYRGNGDISCMDLYQIR